MKAHLIRRFFQTLLILFIVSFLVFFIMRLLPGDPILIYMDRNSMQLATAAQVQALRQEFGLDKPVMVQYLYWIWNALHGDLGTSIFKYEAVTKLILKRVPITFHLGIVALVMSILIGIPAGIISAARRGRVWDTAMTLFANLGITVPIFWLGILMIYLFGLHLRWLPIFGYTSPFEDFWMSSKQVLMPAFCLAVFPMASIARQSRSSMLEVIQQDYIRTAWAKGLGEKAVVLRHAMKNSLIPVVTLLGVMVRNIFGGSVLVETVFNVPGIGRMLVSGVFDHDYVIVQGVIMTLAILVVIANLVVDISYGWLDPRIRASS